MTMPLDIWLAFAITCSALLMIPGPTVLTVVGYAMTNGRPAAGWLTAAVVLGDATALALSLLGLGALLAASATAFSVVKWLGALYLFGLGLQMIRRGLNRQPRRAALSPSRRKLFLNTYLVTALNPKGLVFFVAFLPQFVDPAGNGAVQLSLLAATYLTLATINTALYALFAGGAGERLRSPRAWQRLNLIGGALLSAAGLWALASRRSAV